MEAATSSVSIRQLPVILRGELEPIIRWITEWNPSRVWQYVAVIVAGSGGYGMAMGWYRSPTYALYIAIKFPLIILLTTLGNGLLNGMLAPLLGLNIGFRQSLQAVLMSCTISSLMLGAFAPPVLFMVMNAPPMSLQPGGSYRFIQLVHVAVIACAGVASNLRLGQLLERLGGSAAIGRRVLMAWLAGNLLLGSQLSWILRPFIGSPNLPVEFLRPNAFHGNFFETLIQAAHELFTSWSSNS